MTVKAGVQFSFFTSVTYVICSDGCIKYVFCAKKGSSYAVQSKIYIDCTEDGDLCALSDASFYRGDENAGSETMAVTLCGLLVGIDLSLVTRPDRRCLEQAFADTIFSDKNRHLPGMWLIFNGIGGSNAGHIYNVDGTKSKSLIDAIVYARKQLQGYRQYYTKYLAGYETAELVISGAIIEIRETRRIIGDYQLNIDGFKNQAIFDDEIGRYAYSIDIHACR